MAKFFKGLVFDKDRLYYTGIFSQKIEVKMRRGDLLGKYNSKLRSKKIKMDFYDNLNKIIRLSLQNSMSSP